eukprot:CAMPEP_0197639176 /NCGR_PEP_ID=MMETSP1338-20131121/13872_1 /TAXON_ID=43686 ORGANISM="Pelagodinium beii, Strain RCC1491" /NCGR_SAMPLE_ID=MMETSP1338 /ASSEMBLY_ACC=CAM_ASM_000754 /LENGTH=243 /DNA_ID=CAMNT_0043211863 /DNA_START=346 /DNA_END=1077 /DNA_ORIENTATION=+
MVLKLCKAAVALPGALQIFLTGSGLLLQVSLECTPFVLHLQGCGAQSASSTSQGQVADQLLHAPGHALTPRTTAAFDRREEIELFCGPAGSGRELPCRASSAILFCAKVELLAGQPVSALPRLKSQLLLLLPAERKLLAASLQNSLPACEKSCGISCSLGLSTRVGNGALTSVSARAGLKASPRCKAAATTARSRTGGLIFALIDVSFAALSEAGPLFEGSILASSVTPDSATRKSASSGPSA